MEPFDALLFLSFGGPEGPDDVLPFLENVLRGKNVPEARKREVAEHYHHFGGVSPINAQNRELIAAVRDALDRDGRTLPVYWGNRHWHPLLADTVGKMAADGIRNSLVFLTSAFSSYSSCRQYLEDLEEARHQEGAGAPRFAKLRAYFNHPQFITAWADRAGHAIEAIPAARRSACHVLFTAHSIPVAMADTSAYVDQLTESSRLVAERLALEPARWQLVYQSRSGPPRQPWLEPNIGAAISQLGERPALTDVVIVPIGFISDHIEVLFDLDIVARQAAEQAGLEVVRAATLGTHALFVQMIGELIEERRAADARRPTVGSMGSAPDRCPDDCCAYVRRPRRAP